MKSLQNIFYRAAGWTGRLDLKGKLRRAAENGETEKVIALLDAGADIHADDDLALRLAAANGHTETVRALLAADADIHAKNDCALRWAAEHGHKETVEVLLAAGADIHAMDDYALRWASRNGHTETVRTLLDAGADIYALDGSALRWAEENGHIGTAQVLREELKSREAGKCIVEADGKPVVEIELFPRESNSLTVEEAVAQVIQSLMGRAGAKPLKTAFESSALVPIAIDPETRKSLLDMYRKTAEELLAAMASVDSTHVTFLPPREGRDIVPGALVSARPGAIPPAPFLN